MSEMMNIDRRSLLQNVFALVGASVALSGCNFNTLGSEGPFTFTDKQRALASALAETFVPKTDTPGAIEAGVPKAFEGLLSNWAKPETKGRLLGAMTKIDEAAKADGKGFAELTLAERTALLTSLDVAALKPNPDAPKLTGIAAMMVGPAVMEPDYAQLKTLLVSLYYTSEAALTQELTYNHVPGQFKPSVPITAETRPDAGGPL